MIDARKKALYFCAGPAPTDEERAEAKELGITAFRNASVIERGSYLEPAGFVAGLAPERYQRMAGTTVIPPKGEAESEEPPAPAAEDSEPRDTVPPAAQTVQKEPKKTKGGK